MPLYVYHAFDAAGKKCKGTLDAESDQDAKEKLRAQGVLLTSLKQSRGVKTKENLQGDVLVAFTLQLGQLVGSGVPLYESLLALEEQYRSEACHRIILSLCEQIKAGRSLSDAMQHYPDSFDQQYRAMIAAGESVGTLDVVLERLTTLLKKQQIIKKKIHTALIYPAILGGFSLLIIGVLLGFVVPSIEGVFQGRELNGFTSAIIGLSHFMRHWWWLAISLVAGIVVAVQRQVRSHEGRVWLQRKALQVPLLKTIFLQAAVARFCRTMGTLQQGGLPMIDSLRIARDVMQNVVLQEEIVRAERKIIEGSSLSAELARSHFPSLVARMLAVGEEAGTTAIMLNKIADMYEEDFEKTVERGMALMQPLILIIMGIFIGLILMAVLLPMTDIQSFTT